MWVGPLSLGRAGAAIPIAVSDVPADHHCRDSKVAAAAHSGPAMEPDSLPLLVLGAAVTVADEVDLSDAVSERLQAKIQEMVDLKVCACVCGGGLDRERGWSASSWGGARAGGR